MNEGAAGASLGLLVLHVVLGMAMGPEPCGKDTVPWLRWERAHCEPVVPGGGKAIQASSGRV